MIQTYYNSCDFFECDVYWKEFSLSVNAIILSNSTNFLKLKVKTLLLNFSSIVNRSYNLTNIAHIYPH